MKERKLVFGVLLLLAVGALVVWKGPGVLLNPDSPTSADSSGEAAPDSTGDAAVDATGEAVVLEAYRNRTSDLVVEVAGVISRILEDDRKGSRHQRLILELPSGHTVLIAHNIDLAPRVPVKKGDRVELRGEYEWSSQGGVIHWTHHDPKGRRPGGWIRHAGRDYE